MESNVIRHASKNDYLTKAQGKTAAQSKANKEAMKALSDADKVDISPESKELAKSTTEESKSSNNSSSNESSTKSVAKKLAKLPIPSPSMFPASAPKSVSKPSAELKQRIEKGTINKPTIFFISGFEFFGLSKDDTMTKMAENIPGAKAFSWDQRTEMMDEIKKHHRSQPVVLVGHSLGANTAVKMANELNTLDNGFRKVDLLVTMDAFGFNNDIVPANVVKNLEFFGENNLFLNDGPNVARDTNVTQVVNEIRTEIHTEIDDAVDVQRKIFHGIDAVLASGKVENAVPREMREIKEPKEIKVAKEDKEDKEEIVISPIILIIEADSVESDKTGESSSNEA
jgi:hypothetical protein